MMFIFGIVFNFIARPWCCRIIVWIRVFPPIYLVTLPVTSKDNIQITVIIDVIERSSSLNVHESVVYYVFIPTYCIALIPYNIWGRTSSGNNKIICTIQIYIKYKTGCLLSERTWFRNVSILAGKMSPACQFV